VNGVTGKSKIVAGQTVLVPMKGTAEPHLPDLPAPKVTLARYKAKKAKCVQVRNGVRKVVQCPTKAKKPGVRKPAKSTIQARAGG
jgi:hypothetical protein